MFAKLLTATLTAVLAYMAARKFKEMSDQAKAKVRTRDEAAAKPVATLREDPETGVFRPVDEG